MSKIDDWTLDVALDFIPATTISRCVEKKRKGRVLLTVASSPGCLDKGAGRENNARSHMLIRSRQRSVISGLEFNLNY